MKNKKNLMVISILTVLGVLSASFVFAQTDASVTPIAPRYGGPNYDQDLWTITYNKAIIPVSFTSYHCTSAALVAEYATVAYYNNSQWTTDSSGTHGTYASFIPASASDLSQKIYITISNLNPSTAYNVRIGAKCTSSSPIGSLTYTLNNQFNTPVQPAPSAPDTTPPDAPGNMTVSDVTSTHVTLSWYVPHDNVAVTRYELKYKIGGGAFPESDWAGAPLLAAPGGPQPGVYGTTLFGYNELTPNATYILGLKAYDAAGNASPLAVSPSFTTLAPLATIPAAPTGLTAVYVTTAQGAGVQLTVTDNANNETEYRLYWHLAGTAWPTTFQATGANTWSFPADTRGMSLASPIPNGNYEYQVQACNSAGCSYSNIVLVNVPATATTTTATTTTTTTVLSAFCIVRNNFTSMPSASAPDLGTGYAKISKPGVITPNSIREACSNDDYNALMQSYCTRNSEPAQTEAWAENTTTCGKTGCNYVACPASSNNSQTNNNQTNTNQNTATGTSSSGTPTFTQATSPPSSTPTPTPTIAAPTPPASITQPNINPTGSANEINQANQSSTNQPITQPQTAPSVISGTRCTRYLDTVKSILDSNERYVKNTRQKMRNAPENYVNFDAVTSSLANADGALRDARNLIKNKECSEQTMESLRDKQSDISNVLHDLSAYHTDELQYFRAYAQCKSTLGNRTKRINTFIKKEKSKATKSSLQDAVSEIAQKTQGFAQDASSAQFPEVINQCTDYIKGLDDDVNFYLRTGKF